MRLHSASVFQWNLLHLRQSQLTTRTRSSFSSESTRHSNSSTSFVNSLNQSPYDKVLQNVWPKEPASNLFPLSDAIAFIKSVLNSHDMNSRQQSYGRCFKKGPPTQSQQPLWSILQHCVWVLQRKYGISRYADHTWSIAILNTQNAGSYSSCSFNDPATTVRSARSSCA